MARAKATLRLSAEEKAQGCILPCVYAAASDLVLQTGFPSAQAR